jgi:hypothetical protein
MISSRAAVDGLSGVNENLHRARVQKLTVPCYLDVAGSRLIPPIYIISPIPLLYRVRFCWTLRSCASSELRLEIVGHRVNQIGSRLVIRSCGSRSGGDGEAIQMKIISS